MRDAGHNEALLGSGHIFARLINKGLRADTRTPRQEVRVRGMDPIGLRGERTGCGRKRLAYRGGNEALSKIEDSVRTTTLFIPQLRS